MTNDSKLGLMAGVAAVLVVAVVYHNKPALGDGGPVQAVAGNATTPPAMPPAAVGVPTAAESQRSAVRINAEMRPAGPRL